MCRCVDCFKIYTGLATLLPQNIYKTYTYLIWPNLLTFSSLHRLLQPETMNFAVTLALKDNGLLCAINKYAYICSVWTLPPVLLNVRFLSFFICTIVDGPWLFFSFFTASFPLPPSPSTGSKNVNNYKQLSLMWHL